MDKRLEDSRGAAVVPDGFHGEFIKQMSRLRSEWPELYACIDPARLSEENSARMSRLSSKAFDFDSIAQGGRGEFYRQAQLNPLVRTVGILRLFELASFNRDLKTLSPSYKILDVLGGDGVLTRAINQILDSQSRPSVVTSDISEGMISAAQQYGLFAIRQAAQNLLFKDNTVEGVIIAYGTHHIPIDQRLDACKEAFRVLKPGGRIVFHDFEKGSPISYWFREVVDPYSLTGHSFPHFTTEEMHDLLFCAGFTDIQVEHMYDPFIISGESERGVKQELAEYLLNMYGLVKLVDEHGYEKALEITYALSHKHFKYDYSGNGIKYRFAVSDKQTPRRSEIQTGEDGQGWHIEAPRVALVGSATKPYGGRSQPNS